MADKPLVFKTSAKAWVYNGGATTTVATGSVTSITRSSSTATVTQTAHGYTTNDIITIAGADQTEYNGSFVITVTDADTYTYAVTGTPATPATGTITAATMSITRSSSTATVKQTAHGYATNDVITIAGATQTEYNGSFVVTVTDANTYTYTVTGTPATPATGTYSATALLQNVTDADYPTTTVPGIVYLDGTYYVMTSEAEIYGSGIEAPLTWTALNFITAETETDIGVAISKYLNYLVAFGQWTTEFFYDAAQAAPGSPLLRAENMFLQVGCASAKSIAQCDNTIIWLAQNKENQSGFSRGRSIVSVAGTQAAGISTPAIDRIITEDNLASVKSSAFKHNGHSFYLLTLGTSNVTLVYDLGTKLWTQWTSMIVQAGKSVTSITRSGTTATVICASHGYADGDIITIAGAGQADYNISGNVTYMDANTFTYQVANLPVTPATGTITATGYTEGSFGLTKHTATATSNLFASGATGRLYAMSTSDLTDNGTYINTLVRTQNEDGGNNKYKIFSDADLIGDRVSGHALIRYSKDDYQTWSKYRRVDLSLVRSHISRIGRARRASFDVRITDSVNVRLERLDIQIEGEEK